MDTPDEITIRLSITPTWSILNDVKDKTASFMSSNGADSDLTAATVMCAAELLENAIKYGGDRKGDNTIDFDLNIKNDIVHIRVSNKIRDENDLYNVQSHVERIAAAADPSRLYTERLLELLEHPKPGVSQLGLYRIAYEGEFALDCRYENDMLTVTAQRPFHAGSGNFRET